MDGASSLTPEFQVGARVTVNNEAGPRLARRQSELSVLANTAIQYALPSTALNPR